MRPPYKNFSCRFRSSFVCLFEFQQPTEILLHIFFLVCRKGYRPGASQRRRVSRGVGWSSPFNGGASLCAFSSHRPPPLSDGGKRPGRVPLAPESHRPAIREGHRLRVRSARRAAARALRSCGCNSANPAEARGLNGTRVETFFFSQGSQYG